MGRVISLTLCHRLIGGRCLCADAAHRLSGRHSAGVEPAVGPGPPRVPRVRRHASRSLRCLAHLHSRQRPALSRSRPGTDGTRMARRSCASRHSPGCVPRPSPVPLSLVAGDGTMRSHLPPAQSPVFATGALDGSSRLCHAGKKKILGRLDHTAADADTATAVEWCVCRGGAVASGPHCLPGNSHPHHTCPSAPYAVWTLRTPGRGSPPARWTAPSGCGTWRRSRHAVAATPKAIASGGL